MDINGVLGGVDRARGNLPAVIILHNPLLPDPTLLPELIYGLEEEEVLFQLRASNGGAIELAFQAAQGSVLGVGIGIDKELNIVLHHYRLPPGDPLISLFGASQEAARILGNNAARLVKGIPLGNIV